jgi:integrase
MSSHDTPISPLRQRMIDDTTLRKLSEKTRSGYIRWFKRLAKFLGRSPDTATAEDLRRFQPDLVARDTGRGSVNAAVAALQFFFDVTLGRGELIAKMSHVHQPRKLPTVLGREKVERFLETAPGLMYEAAVATAVDAAQDSRSDNARPCPCCGAPLVIIETFARGYLPRAPPSAMSEAA